MDFRSEFSPGEEHGEDIKVSLEPEVVSTKKIRITMLKGEDNDSFEEQHHIKLEVADTPSFQSEGEDDVEYGEIQVKTEPMDIKPPSSSICTHDSEPNQSRRSKMKSKKLTTLRNKSKIPDPLSLNSNLSEADDDAYQVLVQIEEGFIGEPEVVNLGHISATTFFVNEDEEIKTEPFSILPHSSSNLEWESVSQSYDKCPLCPYTNKSVLRVQTHLKVHEEGVISVPCKNCGVHNLPKKRCNCYQRQYTPKTKTIPLHKRKLKIKKEPEWLTSQGLKKESKHNFNIITLSCNYCPFTVKNSVVGMKKHVKLHNPTSQAVPCLICGAYVLRKSMKRHVGLRHPPQLSKTVRNKMKELTKTKRKRNPDFTVKIKKSKRWYICRKCPYKTIDRGGIDTHAGLHLEGSSAIPCELCNIFVVPEQMEFHQATDHPDPQPKEPIVKITPVGFKCAHCPYETKDRKQSEHHAALHSEDSRGRPCPNCDVYYILNPIGSRHNCGNWNKLKKLRLVKAKRSMIQDESSTFSKRPNPE